MKKRKAVPNHVLIYCMIAFGFYGSFAHANGSNSCKGQESFEKVSRATIEGADGKMLLYGGSFTTKDCLQKCLDSSDCASVVLDYDERSCISYDKNSSAAGTNLNPIRKPVNYFEKICLNAQTCDKLWAVDRAVGFEIEGYDDLVLKGITSRTSCVELCFRERGLPCKSAEYDQRSFECRLSRQDRRSQPLHYRPATNLIHYVENQCYQATDRPHCEYEEFLDHDIKQSEYVRKDIDTKFECKKACEKEASFVCRSFTWVDLTGECKLSSEDQISAGPSAVGFSLGRSFYQRAPCLDLKLDCSVDAMTVELSTSEPFQGRLFSQSFPQSCQSKGVGSKETALTIKFRDPSCGVVDEGEGIFSNVIVVQHHPVIQRKGDKAIKLLCLFQTTNKTITNGFNINFSILGGVAAGIINATAPSPKIRFRIVDRQGNDVTNVKLGDELFLRLDLDNSSIYGILARNLVAKSGDNSNHIALLDEKGCPVDPLIFPSLEVVEGTKSLQGKFEAFKFSENAVVRFQMNVQFCLDQCKPAQCGSINSFGRRKRSVDGEVVLDVSNDQELDPIYHEMPLQKEIIVANAHALPLRNGELPREKIYKMKDLVCTSKEILVAIVIAAVVLQICLILAAIMCIFIRRRNAKLSSNGSSTLTLTVPSIGMRHAVSSSLSTGDSANTLKSLRTTLRD